MRGGAGAVLDRSRQVPSGAVGPAQLNVGLGGPEVNLVLVGLQTQFAQEHFQRARRLAGQQGGTTEIEVLERNFGLQARQSHRQLGRFCAAPELVEQANQVAQGVDVVGLGFQGMAEGRLGLDGVAGAVVDHAQRVGGAEETRVALQGRAGVPVGRCHLPGSQQLDGPVVEVHGDDRGLIQRARALAAHVALRQEVHRQRHVLLGAEVPAHARRAQHQVDVPAGQREAATAAVEVLGLHLLKAHRQAEVAGQAGGHDHQRQAIARARCKRLGSVVGGAGIVGQAQLAVLVERVDEGTTRVVPVRQPDELTIGIRAHGIADGKHPVRVDGPLGRLKQLIAQQGLRVGQQGSVGTPGQADTDAQQGDPAHHSLHAQPP